MEQTIDNKPLNKPDKKTVIIIAAAVAAVAVIAVAVILFINSKKLSATTMRVLQMKGTVSLEENGQEKTVSENLRLKDGNALSTGGESLVSIGLDDKKIVTMDELSRAVFSQKGKILNLELTDGRIFFEVKEKLEDDEAFNINTSTMVVGIRGTSGMVSADEEGRWSITITDGHVHIKATNPDTGEIIETDVYAGQKCTVYTYDREQQSVLFTTEDVDETNLPPFVLDILRNNADLLDKVVEATGWSKPIIMGEAEPEPAEPVAETASVSADTRPGTETAPADAPANTETGAGADNNRWDEPMVPPPVYSPDELAAMMDLLAKQLEEQNKQNESAPVAAPTPAPAPAAASAEPASSSGSSSGSSGSSTPSTTSGTVTIDSDGNAVVTLSNGAGASFGDNMLTVTSVTQPTTFNLPITLAVNGETVTIDGLSSLQLVTEYAYPITINGVTDSAAQIANSTNIHAPSVTINGTYATGTKNSDGSTNLAVKTGNETNIAQLEQAIGSFSTGTNTITYGSNATFTNTDNVITFTTGGADYTGARVTSDNSGNLVVTCDGTGAANSISFTIAPDGTVTPRQ